MLPEELDRRVTFPDIIRGIAEQRRAVGAMFTGGTTIDHFNKRDFEPFILERAFADAEAS